MTEDSSEHSFPQVFADSATPVGMREIQFASADKVDEQVLGNSVFPSQVTTEVNTMYTAAIPAELAGNLPEGTVFQIMPDTTILTPVSSASSICDAIVYQDLHLDNNCTANSIPAASNIMSISNYASEISDQAVNSLSNGLKFPANISDIDLSFLTESDEQNVSSDEIQSIVECSQKSLQQSNSQKESSLTDDLCDQASDVSEANIASNVDNENCVLVDVSKPIQLSQNSLIIVNGMKCVMQQDPHTGQVIAYPVKEPEKPKKKRGRPRKVCPDPNAAKSDETHPQEALAQDSESVSELERCRIKGLLEVVTDDGALVRRSSRKRKRKVLNDYETGNLNQELGSDVEDYKPDIDGDDVKKKNRSKSLGRPRKYPYPDAMYKNGKYPRGRPKPNITDTEALQSFLIQTIDGQTMMVQVPVSIIPAGMTLEDVAQRIANNFNVASQQVEKSASKPAECDIPNLTSVSKYSDTNITSLDIEHDSVPPVKDCFQKETESTYDNLDNSGNTSTILMSEQIVKLAESLSNEAIADILNPSLNKTAIDKSPSKEHSDNVKTKLLHAITDDSSQPSDTFPNNFISESEMISEHGTTPQSEDKTRENVMLSKSSEDINSLYKNADIMNCFNYSETPEIRRSANIHFLQKNVSPKTTGQQSDESSVMTDELTQSLDHIASLDHAYQARDISESPSPSNIMTLELSCDSPSEEVINDCDSVHGNSVIRLSDAGVSTNDLSVRESSNLGLPNVLIEQNISTKSKSTPFCPIIDIQKCFASPVELKSLQHILPSVSSSTSTTMVIPLPDKMLPLLVRKDDEANLPLSSLESVVNLQCILCHCNVESHDAFYQHLLSEHAEDSKKCKCCKFVCLNEEELINHYKKVHPRCICTECNYVAEQPHAVKRHMYQHAEKGITCKICHKTYKDHYILKMHIKMVHTPSDIFYKCEVCLKEFNRKAHMKRHMRTHDPDKPYKCPHCEYRGCEKSDITKHMLIHQEPKHMCEVCGKTFRHLKNKELHMKRHNNQRDFKCGICDFFGYTFTDIRKHIERRHCQEKGVTIVICNRCDQVCKSHEQLKAHQKSGQCGTQVDVPSPEVSSSGQMDGEVEASTFDVASDQDCELLEIPGVKDSVEILDEATSEQLPNSHLIMNNVGDLLNSNGQIIISGLEGVESLSGASFKIISSADDSTNKEVVNDSSFVNENILKLFDSVVFNNNQNQSILCHISS